jgi:DNA invertase Pin-like site-specific DNA recombinase
MKFVSYYRLIANKTGLTRQNLTAQEKKVNRYLETARAPRVVGAMTEFETGPMFDRPALEMCIQLAEKEKATLLIPNCDRLMVSSRFVERLAQTKINFVILDYPEVDREMLKVRVQFAEFERSKISERTKEALEVLQQAGIKLGTPKPHAGGIARGLEMTTNADAFSKKLRPFVRDILKKKSNATLREIAQALEIRGVTTPRGNPSWNASQVRNLFIRLGIET